MIEEVASKIGDWASGVVNRGHLTVKDVEEIAQQVDDYYRQLFEPKPDEGRLLDKNELSSAISEWETQHSIYDPFHYIFICQKQDTKTASIKDAECQERVERIFKEIEATMGDDIKAYYKRWWQALKKKELK